MPLVVYKLQSDSKMATNEQVRTTTPLFELIRHIEAANPFEPSALQLSPEVYEQRQQAKIDQQNAIDKWNKILFDQSNNSTSWWGTTDLGMHNLPFGNTNALDPDKAVREFFASVQNNANNLVSPSDEIRQLGNNLAAAKNKAAENVSTVSNALTQLVEPITRNVNIGTGAPIGGATGDPLAMGRIALESLGNLWNRYQNWGLDSSQVNTTTPNEPTNQDVPTSGYAGVSTYAPMGPRRGRSRQSGNVQESVPPVGEPPQTQAVASAPALPPTAPQSAVVDDSQMPWYPQAATPVANQPPPNLDDLLVQYVSKLINQEPQSNPVASQYQEAMQALIQTLANQAQPPVPPTAPELTRYQPSNWDYLRWTLANTFLGAGGQPGVSYAERADRINRTQNSPALGQYEAELNNFNANRSNDLDLVSRATTMANMLNMGHTMQQAERAVSDQQRQQALQQLHAILGIMSGLQGMDLDKNYYELARRRLELAEKGDISALIEAYGNMTNGAGNSNLILR